MLDIYENIEVSLEEWQTGRDKFSPVDIRDDVAYAYGHLPGSVNIPQAEIEKDFSVLPKRPLLICRSGEISLALAETLRESGIDAYSFSPGYAGWLRETLRTEESKAKDVEASIRKKFTKNLETLCGGGQVL